MRDVQSPKHLLIAVANGDEMIWRIQRGSDMAACAMDRSYTLTCDDGEVIDVASEPTVREWRSADAAGAYLARLEDGSAGTAADDLPVAWVLVPDLLTPPPPMHVDGPL